jgi:hypothetical protein
LGQIAACARERFGPSRGQRRIRGHATEDERLAVVNANWKLFLSIVQELPFVLPPRTRDGTQLNGQQCRVEWDHIWPQDQRRQFRYSRRFAAGSNRIGHAGNFWALDAPLNNRARAQLPSWKFRFLLRPTDFPGMPDCWPRASEVTLSTNECEELERIEALVTGSGRSAPNVDEGTRRFADLVDRRGLRLFDRLSSDARFGSWLAFSVSSVPGEIDASDVDPVKLGKSAAQELGLAAPSIVRSKHDGEGLEAVMSQARQAGVEADLRLVIDAACRCGFHVSSARTNTEPYQHKIRIALNRTGARRRGVCWFVPVVERKVLRVGFSADNLRGLMGLERDEIRKIFGADRDRDWKPGSGEQVVAEVIEPLRRRFQCRRST